MMTNTNQFERSNNETFPWFVMRFLIGTVLGAIVYILITGMIINQTDLGCYQTGLVRSVVEGTRLLAWLLIEYTIPSESIYFQLVLYGLSSLPYAMLGGFIASGLKKEALLSTGLLMIYTCLTLFFWGMFVATTCA